MEESVTDRGQAATACQSCGGNPRWEALVDGVEERWLSVCRCGRMRAFLADHPELDPEDPVRAYLHGLSRPLPPTSPPWARLFLRSLEAPIPVRWRYCPGRCDGCSASATFGMHACPRASVLALNALCLSCGRVEATYFASTRGMQASPASGSAWSPPCPAVQRLRDCVFRPHAMLAEEDGGSPARWLPVQ